MVSLYLHIPFCEVKCGYCDFYSLPRGHEDWDLQTEYVRALSDEIDSRCPTGIPFGHRTPVQTIFFGGGTPSLLKPSLMEELLKKLADYFVWDQTAEVTFEANPKTVSVERFKDFRSLGFNRVSVGIQSFNDSFLKVLGRYHAAADGIQAIQDAKQAGFENINLDLIFGLPGQTVKDWESDLQQATQLETPHISAYNLTIEEGTPFAKLYPKTKPALLPIEEDQIRMFEKTREFLAEKGLQAYEISNFARPGSECRHNKNYWEYGEYFGFGVSAASFVAGRRRTNIRDLKKYLAGGWEGSTETISPKQAMGEFLFLGLRLTEGISVRCFQELFGESLFKVYGATLDKFISKGSLALQGDRLTLTPQGLLLANELFVEFV
ncbi:MAG: radical SAM family heme chaperone HemW [Deltaproteobacteria bacterium]|nr:radical SAM family heme chaperone HemW [Deltaproteobacteria bacterium]